MSEEERSKELNQQEEENTYFPNAQIVRLIRQENPDKIIKKRVKIALNQLLERIAINISKQMAKKPYATITYTDFLDAARPYLELERISQERRRVVATLKKIKEDAEALIMDLEDKEREMEDYF